MAAIVRESIVTQLLFTLRLYLSLMPILGVPLSLWTLYGQAKQPHSQLQQTSRLAIVLGMGWLLATVLLSAGAHSHFSQMATLRFWIAGSLIGSGYFLTSLWLMFKISQGKTPKLPGLTQLSRRLPE